MEKSEWEVTCGDKLQLVSVSEEHRQQLAAGELPCPVCSKGHGPTLQPIEYGREVTVQMWTGKAWQTGVAYKVDTGRP